MAKKATIHTDIFITYELTQLSKSEKETIRHHIRKIMPKEFKEKKWEDISQMDRDIFIYITAQDYLMRYVPAYRQASILRKITRKVSDSLLNVKKDMLEHNQNISLEPYFVEGDSISQMREAYKRYKKDYHKYYAKEPDETFEKWSNTYVGILGSQKASIRPYDLYMAADTMSIEKTGSENHIDDPARNAYLTSAIPYYTIQTICLVLRKKFGIKIDVDKIDECVSYLYDNPHDTTEPFDMESEQDKKYAVYMETLNRLAFWSEEKSDSRY